MSKKASLFTQLWKGFLVKQQVLEALNKHENPDEEEEEEED